MHFFGLKHHTRAFKKSLSIFEKHDYSGLFQNSFQFVNDHEEFVTILKENASLDEKRMYYTTRKKLTREFQTMQITSDLKVHIS